MKTPAALKAPRGVIFKGNVGQPSKSGAAVRFFQPDFAGAVLQSEFPARLVRHGCSCAAVRAWLFYRGGDARARQIILLSLPPV